MHGNQDQYGPTGPAFEVPGSCGLYLVLLWWSALEPPQIPIHLQGGLRRFFLPPRGQLVILQHRQGRTLVLAIGPPRAGLDTLTEVGVRCVKEVVVDF